MDTATSKVNEEAQIRKLIDEWVAALRAKDVDKMMANYSPDVLVFGVTPPLQYTGAKEYRQKWEEMFSSIQGPVGYEARDLTITTSDDIAFSHCVNRISGKMKSSEDSQPPWIRVTLCFRKIEGSWLVTHEHASVPFDVAGGKASLDLKP